MRHYGVFLKGLCVFRFVTSINPIQKVGQTTVPQSPNTICFEPTLELFPISGFLIRIRPFKIVPLFCVQKFVESYVRTQKQICIKNVCVFPMKN